MTRAESKNIALPKVTLGDLKALADTAPKTYPENGEQCKTNGERTKRLEQLAKAFIAQIEAEANRRAA